MVVPGGFSWQDKTYPSLSTIAQAITGTSWNGPASSACGEERPGGSGRACSRREGSVARLKPELHPIQRARIAGHGGSAMKAAIPKPLRCAIYTRKSTEHNLDLAFNSLDAQRGFP